MSRTYDVQWGKQKVLTPPTATGGTVTTYTDEHDTEWTVHTFTEDGTFEVTAAGDVERLIVAGGGSGGWRGAGTDGSAGGGGGGAGGAINDVATLTSGSYSIVIGDGGAAPTSDVVSGAANDGEDTTAFGLTAVGGGAGNRFNANGRPGGSGGGVGARNIAADGTGGAGTEGQGHDGGSRTQTGTDRGGAGGGGAGGPGGGITSDSKDGFPGGVGITFMGTEYAKGGQGGDATQGARVDGPANTGQGGKGGSFDDPDPGSGGSGIVIVRYPTQPAPVPGEGDSYTTVTGIEEDEYELTGLDADTAYEWRVRADDDGAKYAWSDWEPFETMGGSVTIPTGLAITATDATSVTWGWNP